MQPDAAEQSTIVAILTYPGVTALDAIGPYEVLHGIPDVEVRFVWKEVGPVMADSGVLVMGATHTLTETPRPDVVLVPGSSGDTAVIMADDTILSWLEQAHAHSRFTTSVCSGALILAAAGILDGHPATTHWAAMEALGRLGAEPRPQERVVRSDKIITAAGVSSGIDMALVLAAELFGERTAKVAQLWIEYDPQPPFDSGHISKAEAEVVKLAKGIARGNATNMRSLAALPAIVARRFKKVIVEAVRGE